MAGHTMTFRMPATALLALPVVLAGVGVALLWLATAQRSAPIGTVGLYLGLLALWMLVANSVLQVQVGPDGVRIRSLRRRNRPVRWDEVRAITVEPHRNGQRVTLWRTTGIPVQLPLPMTNKSWNAAAFLRDYHRIGQYWQAMRGT